MTFAEYGPKVSESATIMRQFETVYLTKPEGHRPMWHYKWQGDKHNYNIIQYDTFIISIFYMSKT